VKARWLPFALAAVAALLLTRRGMAAQDVAVRLDGHAPAAVVRAVQAIAQDAAARGLPVEPLIQKTLEGSAKGVPPERVIAAVRLLSARLDEARTALRAGGIVAPNTEALEGGAYALSAGLNADQVRDLGRISLPVYDPALTLHIAATLTALGVPASQGVQLLQHMIQAGRTPSELLDLPGEVQASMSRGASAAQAAEALDIEEGGLGQHGHQGEQGEQRENRPHRP
jgi:hypothetical protein